MEGSQHRYAGFSKRLLAHNIDLIPILLFLYGLTFLIPKTDYDLFLYLGVYLFYHIGFELSKWQGTPGKKWTGIYVEYQKSEFPLPFLLLRNLCKILSLVLFFGGFIMILFNVRKQALHDYIAGTVVLLDE